ncbi:DUF6538 domain-containing protein [Acidimangrovimonas sediminis]|uniref:DUF6538 domain-containing protein n=1 Tax=Acidimangrovimonas sediminis TaxID=2056283 RepID=UPI0038B8C2BD
MHQKKSILPNGIADDQSATLPSAHRGASHCASHRRGGAGRRWGLHLVRRNGIFHFRRRWPETLRHLGAPEFLSVSLRTNFLSIATERACGLRAALSIGERELIAELETKQLSPGQVSAFLREMVRRAVVGMLGAQDAP